MTHLEMSKLLSRRQFGFRPGLSTVDAIGTLIDDVGLSLNNHHLTIATFIDLKKAFDTLDHDILVNRITDLCFHQNTIKWFKSYLSNRSQRTLINNILSDKAPLTTGVPQGSILGPLLFIIYVNSLPDVPQNSKTIMYADDTVIYTPISKSIAPDELAPYQTDLNLIANWCQANKLSINVKKTEIMLLGVSQRHYPKPNCLPTLQLNNQPLTVTESYKYLGLLLTPSLNFNDHMKKIIGTVTGKINTLSYLRKYVTEHTALQIYKTTILPLLEYANIIIPLISTTQQRK